MGAALRLPRDTNAQSLAGPIRYAMHWRRIGHHLLALMRFVDHLAFAEDKQVELITIRSRCEANPPPLPLPVLSPLSPPPRASDPSGGETAAKEGSVNVLAPFATHIYAVTSGATCSDLLQEVPELRAATVAVNLAHLSTC